MARRTIESDSGRGDRSKHEVNSNDFLRQIAREMIVNHRAVNGDGATAEEILEAHRGTALEKYYYRAFQAFMDTLKFTAGAEDSALQEFALSAQK